MHDLRDQMFEVVGPPKVAGLEPGERQTGAFFLDRGTPVEKWVEVGHLRPVDTDVDVLVDDPPLDEGDNSMPDEGEPDEGE